MTEKPALPPAPDLSGAPHSDLHEALRDLQASATWKVRPSQQLIDRIVAGCRLLASQDMEQRAGWMPIDTAPKDDGVMLAVRSNFGLYVFLHGHWLGDFWVGLNADLAVQRVEPTHWMPLPAPPIEALEGGKTDLGASGPVHQDTSSTPASESELRNLVAALRKLGEPVYAIGGELPLGSDQLIALDAANAIERLSSKAGGSQA